MEEAQGTQEPGSVRARIRVRKRRRIAPTYRRGISAFFHLLGFVMTFLLGVIIPWIYYAYHPGPLETRFGLVGYYLYFTIWLGMVIYLLGGMIFGRSRQWWQLAVYLALGIGLGWIGGWIFARSLGTYIGLLTGICISPLVFFVRWGLLVLEL
jgi:hypothetical protein